MARYASADHHIVQAIEWDPAKPAERINDFLLMSRGCSNSYVVTSDAGDVVINTGTPGEAEHRQRYEGLLGRPLKVVKIIFTQDHGDHCGGWKNFYEPGVEMIVQANFPRIAREREALWPFFVPRIRAALPTLHPPPPVPATPVPATPVTGLTLPEPLTFFDTHHAFEVGGRRFELISAPSGETLNNLMVWLPKEKVVFTGNWAGALYGALPHFYTVRGDRERSVPTFILELERLIALEPELLVTGHDDPIVGAARIRADLTKLLAAIRYFHDETVKGMRASKDLWTLMREIELPAELTTAPGRGPTRWYVRAVWEEYTGWFRQESTTELYGVPAKTVWPQLAAMAGGPDALTAAAQARLAAGEPLQALHLVEVALAAEPKHRGALEASIAAFDALIDLTGGRPYDEIGWLETQILRAKAVLQEA